MKVGFCSLKLEAAAWSKREFACKSFVLLSTPKKLEIKSAESEPYDAVANANLPLKFFCVPSTAFKILLPGRSSFFGPKMKTCNRGNLPNVYHDLYLPTSELGIVQSFLQQEEINPKWSCPLKVDIDTSPRKEKQKCLSTFVVACYVNHACVPNLGPLYTFRSQNLRGSFRFLMYIQLKSRRIGQPKYRLSWCKSIIVI